MTTPRPTTELEVKTKIQLGTLETSRDMNKNFVGIPAKIRNNK